MATINSAVALMTKKQAVAEAKDAQQYKSALGSYSLIQQQQKKGSEALGRQYQDRLKSAMAQLQGLGQAERADIGQVYQQRMSQADQGLTSRGLGNTTVRANVQRGMAAGEAQDVGRLNERLRNQQLGVYTSLSGEALGSQAQQDVQRTNLLSQIAGAKLAYRSDRPGYGTVGQLLGQKAQIDQDNVRIASENQRLAYQARQQYMDSRMAQLQNLLDPLRGSQAQLNSAQASAVLQNARR